MSVEHDPAMLRQMLEVGKRPRDSLSRLMVEVEELRRENDRLKADMIVMADRLAKCSECLGKAAERRGKK